MKNSAGLKSPVSAKQLLTANTLACHIPVPGYMLPGSAVVFTVL